MRTADQLRAPEPEPRPDPEAILADLVDGYLERTEAIITRATGKDARP